jgi:4-nitrophenyl phosphatase
MDGVLWRDTEAIGDLPALLKLIEQKGLKVAFVTNNATRTVEQYQEKFRGFGAEVAADQIHTSSKAAAHFLSEKHPAGGTVHVIGERGLREALTDRGFSIGDSNPLAVVVGLDRELSYEKLKQATILIRSGVPFIGTNPDRTLPSPAGEVPGAGSILAALEAATGVQPLIIGKPERALLDGAMAQLGVGPGETLMAGDRIETDVAAGQAAGTHTALLLSGVTTIETARTWQPAPDYIEADLETLLAKL